MDARELIAAARRRKAAGDLVETEKLLRSAISRAKNDSSALFTAQYFLGQLLLQAHNSKAEGIAVLQQAWNQGIEVLQGSAAGTSAARAILYRLCCVLLLHLDIEQSTEAAVVVRQQYAEHLSTTGDDAASAYACATCKSSITEISGSIEDDALWYCSPCIAAYAAEMLAAGCNCATCDANSTNTDGSIESDNQWYCKACIEAYELESQSTSAAAAPEKLAENTTAEVSACCNCSDSTVPLIQTSSQSKLYCEACLQELAESGDTVLRYTAEELRLQHCNSALSTAALPDSVAAMYARHSIVAVDSRQQQQQQRGPKQHKQKQQQQQQSKPNAAQSADLPLHQQQGKQQQQQDQQQQQQCAQAHSLASDAAVAAVMQAAAGNDDAIVQAAAAVPYSDDTNGDDPLL
jgi:hypothetical protein